MTAIWKCDNCGFLFQLDAHESTKQGSPMHSCLHDAPCYYFCRRVGSALSEDEKEETSVPDVILVKR